MDATVRKKKRERHDDDERNQFNSIFMYILHIKNSVFFFSSFFKCFALFTWYIILFQIEKTAHACPFIYIWVEMKITWEWENNPTVHRYYCIKFTIDWLFFVSIFFFVHYFYFILKFSLLIFMICAMNNF